MLKAIGKENLDYFANSYVKLKCLSRIMIAYFRKILIFYLFDVPRGALWCLGLPYLICQGFFL